MLMVTISNWRKKVKILLLVVLLLLIAWLVFAFADIGKDPETGAVNDRDGQGSMKVEATTEGDAQEVDGNWFGEFVETLKGYYQD